jgi:hypothetical protein
MKKHITTTAPSKLLAKFDQQLLEILTADLKAFKAKNPHYRRAGQQQQLIAA